VLLVQQGKVTLVVLVQAQTHLGVAQVAVAAQVQRDKTELLLKAVTAALALHGLTELPTLAVAGAVLVKAVAAAVIQPHLVAQAAAVMER
jgi:uncharacterized membrane protein SpoIIM required for sporulation